jgi:hypothetical protein
MERFEGLSVDSIAISNMPASPEMRAVFTDSMLRRHETTIGDYYADSNPTHNPFYDQVMEIYELVAPSQLVADRLDVLGFDRTLTLRALDKALEEARTLYADWATANRPESVQADAREQLTHLDGYTALDWIRDLETAACDPDDGLRSTPGSRSWLLGHIEDLDNRFVLRAVLLALTDAEVRLDISAQVGGWRDKPETFCSEGLAAMRATAAMHAPIIVLTEGRTDIQVLQPALDLLYPHLIDLIRFMDYAERPEGGAGALVRTVRAFAAAGVVNRVVALFDNDTAATDALRNLAINELPAGIHILRYPELDLAMDYPTLGPPTADAPTGRLEKANVNGLAGSIELYLGRDVLTGSDGTLRPVQWRSFVPGARQYQGEIVNKEAVLDAYRAKVEAARVNPERMAVQDWSGLQAILELVRSAFRSGNEADDNEPG